MTSRQGKIGLRSGAAAGAAALACALVLAVSAPAQEARAPAGDAGQPPAAAPPAAAAPNPAFQPGFIDALGRWLEQGTSRLKSGMQGAQETIGKLGGQARDAAKDATGAVVGLPNTRVVAGRERCAPAANGAPDCQTAALTVCRGKGFQAGRSVDTQSEQKCPARLLLEGRAPNDGECPTEIFVTRAMCQ